jgi:mono/diheme cytochrome c family protein
MAAEPPPPSFAKPLGVAAAITAVVLALAFLHPFKPSAKASGTPVAAGDVAHGKTLFDAKCAGCHGAAGAGGGGGPKLAGLTLDSGAIAAQIANGGGAMPAALVTGKDSDDVVVYVRSLGAPAPAATAAAGTTSAPATTAAPTTSTAAPAQPAAAVAAAAAALPKALAAGAGQVDVLSQHVGFLDQAFDQANLANVRFHGEHLVNIALGAPARDLDDDGVARNPGDGVGLVGHQGRAYVTRAQAVLAQVAADPGVPADVASQARTASDEAATLASLVVRLTGQARACARATSVASAVGARRRIDALSAQIATQYARLQTDADAVSKGLGAHG